MPQRPTPATPVIILPLNAGRCKILRRHDECSTRKIGESDMLNLIGTVPAVEKVVAIDDCHLHHYGKAFKAGRKVGHATLRSVDRATLDRQITAVESLIDQA